MTDEELFRFISGRTESQKPEDRQPLRRERRDEPEERGPPGGPAVESPGRPPVSLPSAAGIAVAVVVVLGFILWPSPRIETTKATSPPSSETFIDEIADAGESRERALYPETEVTKGGAKTLIHKVVDFFLGRDP